MIWRQSDWLIVLCGGRVDYLGKRKVAAVLDERPVAKRVQLIFRARPMLPDPKDEMVLETPITVVPIAIVTFNDRHLGRGQVLSLLGSSRR